ncbi:MAG: M56 family metallopeptidase, partial [Phycisphaerales bacterium]
MNDYLTQITDYLLTQSWQIAVLVVVVAAATLLLGNKSAHVRYLLWLIVLAKCLVPPFLTVPLAVLPEERVSTLSAMPEDRIAVALERPEMRMAEAPASPAPSAAEPVTIVQESLPQLSVRQWAGLGWIVGAALFVLVAVTKALRTEFWLRRQRKLLSTNLQSEIEGLFCELGVRVPPKVWLVEGIGQPFVWGLLHGGIYLPANFVKANNAEHRRGIIGHELSHILRFDAVVNLLQVMAQAVFWFHPLVWWANRRIRAEREKCCDEMTIARLGTKAQDYSDAIVNIVISESESTRPVPSLAVAGPVKNIEERIKTMLRPGKKFYKRPSLVAATFVLLLALLTVPTALVLTARAETKPNAEAKEKSPTAPGPATAEGRAAATAALFRALPDNRTVRPDTVERMRLAIAQGADLEAKNSKG